MTSPARQLLIDGTDAPATTGGGYLPSVLLDRAPNHAMRESEPSITTRHSYLTAFRRAKTKNTE